MGAGQLSTNLIPEAMDNSLSYSVLNYLKRLKNQAKTEYDRIVSLTPHKGKFGPEGIKVVQRSSIKRDIIGLSGTGLRDQVTEFPGYMLQLPQQKGIEAHPLRNPFDIPRDRLLDQLVRMRLNLIGGGRGRAGVHMVDSDTRHSLPIGTMGNYQDYLKKQPTPLRELESQPVRQHMFGNPFKTNKNLMMMDEVSGIVDEVQLVGVGGPQQGANRGVKRPADLGGLITPGPPKRRKGALPKDFQYQSPSSSPSHSAQFPTPPPSPMHLAPTQVLVPQHPTVPAPSSQHQPRPISNGVTVSGGVGPVYPSGKMAAFKSLCDTDLDNSDYTEDLVIADQPLNDVGKTVKKEEESIENVENVVEIFPNKAVNQSRSPLCGGKGVQISPLTQDNKVIKDVASVKREKNDASGVTNGDHSDHVKKIKVEMKIENLEKENHIKTNSNNYKVKVEELSPDELRSIRLRNNNVRQLIYKEVKKPGINHGGLWEMLANLHGPPWVKRQFIQEVRQEAVRYIHMLNKIILTSPSPIPNPVLKSQNRNVKSNFALSPL